VSGRRNRPKHPKRPTRKMRRPARAGCGKVGYRDRAEAIEWLHILTGAKQRHGSDNKLETRVYECDRCHAAGAGSVWHTTSQERRTA
jgi:hypothetical protein